MRAKLRMSTSPPSDMASARPTNGPTATRAVDGAGRQRSLEDHLAAGQVFAVVVDVAHSASSGLGSALSLIWFSFRALLAGQPTMKGSTDLRTSSAPAASRRPRRA